MLLLKMVEELLVYIYLSYVLCVYVCMRKIPLFRDKVYLNSWMVKKHSYYLIFIKH